MKRLLLVSFFITFITLPLFGFAQTDATTTHNGTPAVVTEEIGATVYFFHSPTCPHCRKEQVFLDKMEQAYPTLTVLRFDVRDSEYTQLMTDLAEQYGAERYLGNVPLTFIGESYFVGFGSDETTGREIERAIQTALDFEVAEETEEESATFDVPVFGAIDKDQYSLPVLAILLGFLDGFNVCSLGSLVLIIGLSLKLQRRKAIVALGGTFILTTALVYGVLIVAWYHIFDIFTQYIDAMNVVVGLLAVGGGAYFMKEYFRMKTQGAQCELQESKLITKMMSHTTAAFEQKTKFFGIVAAVLFFAAVVAVVEFPCSAAVPVVFAGILAEAGMSTVAYLSHIGLFVLFYLLDEIIIFGIAAYRLKLWMTSGTFTKYAVLAEALILLGIGVFYLGATVGLL
jgi:thiol-disulfide isomerase/thioredoxin